MVTAGAAEECIKLQSNLAYDNYKEFETEKVVGDPLTMYTPEN